MRSITYLNNYWSIYNEFIKYFSDLKFRRIPLALIPNFYQLLDQELMDEMDDEEFVENYLECNLDEHMIQPEFDKYLNEIIIPIIDKPGKLLIHKRYSKLEQYNFKIFDPKNTIILGKNSGMSLYNIPMRYFEKVKLDTDGYMDEANRLFEKYKDHRVFGNTFFKEKVLKQIPVIINLIESCFRFYEDNNIGCVLVGTTEDSISRSLVIVGRMMGIPSLCMQHGLITGEEAFLPIFANKMCINGFYDEDLLLNKGVVQGQYEITGHPRFDVISNDNRVLSKNLFFKKYNLDLSKKTIFIATQHFAPNHWDEFIEKIEKEMDVQIIIKPHPVEVKRGVDTHYKDLAKEYPQVKIISEHSALYDIIGNVDLGLVVSSTVGIEIMLFNKPLIVMKNDRYDFYDGLGYMSVGDTDELIGLVKGLLTSNKQYKNALDNMQSFLDYIYPQRLSGIKLKKIIDKYIL